MILIKYSTKLGKSARNSVNAFEAAVFRYFFLTIFFQLKTSPSSAELDDSDLLFFKKKKGFDQRIWWPEAIIKWYDLTNELFRLVDIFMDSGLWNKKENSISTDLHLKFSWKLGTTR